MKDTLLSLIRHALIALVSLGAFLASRGMIAPEDVEAVNASGATIREALAVALTAMWARLILKVGGMILPALKKGGKGGSGGPGLSLWVLGFSALCLLALPACTAEQWQAIRGVPVKACYTDDKGNSACYSTKDGIEVDVGSGK